MSETEELPTPTNEDYTALGEALWQTAMSHFAVRAVIEDTANATRDDMANGYVEVWKKLTAQLSAAESRAAAAEAECERLRQGFRDIKRHCPDLIINNGTSTLGMFCDMMLKSEPE